ncbi:MAG: RNA polymerase Rpb4 [Desulfurococcaceae archaeon]
MGTPINIKAEKVEILSNSEVLKILKEYSEREKEVTGTIPLLIQRVLEYLHKFSKIDIERSRELREKLVSFGFKDESIVMIMNICPASVDELRSLLILEDKVYETTILEQVVALLKDYCFEEE